MNQKYTCYCKLSVPKLDFNQLNWITSFNTPQILPESTIIAYNKGYYYDCYFEEDELYMWVEKTGTCGGTRFHLKDNTDRIVNVFSFHKHFELGNVRDIRRNKLDKIKKAS